MSDSFSDGVVPHAKIDLPKPEVHAKHPLRNEETHQALLGYVRPRLMIGKQHRDGRLGRMVRIDKNVMGWMKMSDDDKARQRQQDKDGIPQALQLNLPLNFVQLDDMMTYYSQTFAPNRGMFYQMGKPDEQEPSSQIVTIMNNHAIYAGYYRETLKSIYSILKYNAGGLYSYWSKDVGPKLVKGVNNTDALQMDTVWEGNRTESLDMYNTFWDPSVDAAKVHRDGEWCARTRLVSHYTLQSEAAKGMYFNCEDMLESDNGLNQCVYYRSPPMEANVIADDSTGGQTNWVNVLASTPGYAQATGFEITEVFIKLNPFQMNLIPQTKQNRTRNRYEIWRLTLLNDDKFIDITYMSNIHGFLPFFFGLLNDDSMGSSQKSAGEIIQPLQDFASFLLNTHVRATRKNIWGLTVYDSSVVDLSQIPAGEVSARVPAKPTGQGKNIRDSIWEHTGQLDTKQTMQDLDSVMKIISVFFPTTSAPSQIASIDRAVTNQVAAVQQGANRRMQKGARLLDDTMFRPFRFCLYYNIIQFQQDGATLNDFYGRSIQIDLEKVRATDLPFIIGQGLKAIDRQAAAASMQQIIFALIQNPAAAQRVDVLGMIDYWTSMIDVDIDMKQFEIQQQAGDPAQTNPDGTPVTPGVQPATNPAAVTAPLRGGSGA